MATEEQISRRDALRAIAALGVAALPSGYQDAFAASVVRQPRDSLVSEIISLEDQYKEYDRDIDDEELEHRLLPLWLRAFAAASSPERLPGPGEVRFYRADHGDLPLPGGNVNIDLESRSISVIHVHRLKSFEVIRFNGVSAPGIEWMRWILFHELSHWEINVRSAADIVHVLNDQEMRQYFSYTDPSNRPAGTRLILPERSYNVGFGIAACWEGRLRERPAYGMLFTNIEEQFAEANAAIASEDAGLSFRVLTRGAPELRDSLRRMEYPIEQLRRQHRASDVRALAEQLAALDAEGHSLPVLTSPALSTEPDYALKLGFLKLQVLHERGRSDPPSLPGPPGSGRAPAARDAAAWSGGAGVSACAAVLPP